MKILPQPIVRIPSEDEVVEFGRAALAVVLAGMVSLLVLPDASAQTESVPVPDRLEPWVGWVLYEEPEIECPRVDSEPACVWPERLQIRVSEEGAQFELDVWTDRQSTVRLPGSRDRWPVDVETTAEDATRKEGSEGVPVVEMPAGDHTVRGSFRWESTPERLAIPEDVATVDLRREGEAIASPRIDEEHRLSLRQTTGGAEESDEDESLQVSVYRRIEDGVPMSVTTEFELNVSGEAREVSLGDVLLAEGRAREIDSDLPTQVTPEGEVEVYLRPGTHTVQVDSVIPSAVDSLGVPTPDPDVYGPREVWVWLPDDDLRSVEIEGLATVDPSRTSLPEKWHGHTTLLAEPGRTLEFAVTRRGKSPSPNRLELDRTFWLDLDGGGYTIQDRLTGEMRRDWRLDYRGRADLGHVRDMHDADDLLITENPESGREGVEVRRGNLDLRAELRHEGELGDAPIVGWNHDVQSLDATLHLPPGWSIVTASGVDRVTPGWLASWSMWNLFFVLIVALGVGKLLGWRWTPIALVALVATHGYPEAPRWVWLHLLAAVALLRVSPPGVWRRFVRAYWLVALVVLFTVLAGFVDDQVEAALYPQLERGPRAESAAGRYADAPRDATRAEGTGGRKPRKAKSPDEEVEQPTRRREAASDASRSEKTSELDYREVAPQDVVQTGPGVPDWTWKKVSMEWSGPVQKRHEIDPWLVSPTANRLLIMIRIAFLIVLALLFTIHRGSRRGEGEEEGAAPGELWSTLAGSGSAGVFVTALAGTSVLSMLLSGPAMAETGAAPAESRLDTLRERLVEAGRCDGPCVVAPSATLTIRGREVTLEAEVEAQRAAGWTLPGPPEALRFESVELDGRSDPRLRRDGEGFVSLLVPEGRHRIRAEGRLPSKTSVTLQFDGENKPRYLEASSEEWVVDGVEPSGAVADSLQLTRVQPAADGGTGVPAESNRASPLEPWFHLEREVVLGLPWKVKTTVSRSSATTPERLDVPVLKEGSVLTEGIAVEGGTARVTFERGETSVVYTTEIPPRDQLTLSASEGKAWTETWRVSCTRIWRCEFSGLPPTSLIDGGRMGPKWRPWPGESLTIDVRRPAGTEGRSATIEDVDYRVILGRRLLEGRLELQIRATQGGWRHVTLPDEADIRQTTFDGSTREFRRDGSTVDVPVRPGTHSAVIRWRQPWEANWLETVPGVEIDDEVANVDVHVDYGDQRWLVWVTGPDWGPAVSFWSHLALLIVLAVLLGRLRGLPLETHDWMLLAIGFSQLPPIALVPVVGWFAAMTIRREHRPDRWWLHDSMQLVLVGLTLAAGVALYAALYQNFLLNIDMQVAGAESSAGSLHWYVDRVSGTLPAPSIVSAPNYVWRGFMLVWALWLAWRLLDWLPWGWASFSEGDILRFSWGGDDDDPEDAADVESGEKSEPEPSDEAGGDGAEAGSPESPMDGASSRGGGSSDEPSTSESTEESGSATGDESGR